MLARQSAIDKGDKSRAMCIHAHCSSEGLMPPTIDPTLRFFCTGNGLNYFHAVSADGAATCGFQPATGGVNAYMKNRYGWISIPKPKDVTEPTCPDCRRILGYDAA